MIERCQLRSKIKGVICGLAVAKGTVFWIDAHRARQCIEQNVAEAMGMGLPGPSEIKPMEPAEKKSSAAGPDGRSIDSAASSEPGTAASQSASPEAPVSPRRRSRRVKPEILTNDDFSQSQ